MKKKRLDLDTKTITTGTGEIETVVFLKGKNEIDAAQWKSEATQREMKRLESLNNKISLSHEFIVDWSH